MAKFSTVICGHRGGGGDPQSAKILTAGAKWSHLQRKPDAYDLRTVWENRLRTFTYMLGKGVTCFELDLLPSKNGDAIIIHDSIVDGEHVWSWNTKELQKKGYCTLETLLDAMEKSKKKVTLLLELKGAASSELVTDTGKQGISRQSTVLVNAVVKLLKARVNKKHGWTYDQLPIIGFNHAMLAMAKKKNPKIKIGLTYAKESKVSAAQMVKDAKKAGAYAINPDDRLITKALVTLAHKAGLKVQSWTAYRVKPNPKKMLKLGVDTLVTDYPLAARKLSASA